MFNFADGYAEDILIHHRQPLQIPVGGQTCNYFVYFFKPGDDFIKKVTGKLKEIIFHTSVINNRFTDFFFGLLPLLVGI